MNPDRSEFKPHYPLVTRVFIYGLPTVFFILLFMAGSTRLTSYVYLWLVIFLLGLITSLLPFFIIREILFMEEMIIRRRFLPDQFIAPAEYGGVMNHSILTSGKKIRIGYMLNLEELRTLASRWAAASNVRIQKAKPLQSRLVYPTSSHGQYASFWGLIFGLISIFVLPENVAVDPRWILGGTFLGVYLIYGYVLPRVI